MNELVDFIDLKDRWREKFDHIYCISYAPYQNRRKLLIPELKRIGILDSGIFSFHYTINNYLDDILLNSSNFNREMNNPRFNKAALNLAIGHYSVMKESLQLGYKKILILEDDVVFRKNLDEVVPIIKPNDDVDIVLYDWVGIESQKNFFDVSSGKLKKYYQNTGYGQYDKNLILWGTSCYAVNDKAMQYITFNQEQKFNVADYYTNSFTFFGDNLAKDPLVRFFAYKHIAIQRPNRQTISNHGINGWVYQQNGLSDFGTIDIKDYNIEL